MRALLSVANRDGISAFARGLLDLGVEIYATDGTRDHLAEDGIDVAPVSDLTQVPAMLGGQVSEHLFVREVLVERARGAGP